MQLLNETSDQALTVGGSAADWTQGLAFKQFDPSLGTLVDVRVELIGGITGSASVENLSPAAATASIGLSGVISLSGPDGVGIASVASNPTVAVNLGAFDGSRDFAGTSGTVVSGFSGSQSTTAVFNPTASRLAAFTGTGSVSLTARSSVGSSQTGSGNLLTQILANAGATVSLRYDYLAPRPGDDDGHPDHANIVSVARSAFTTFATSLAPTAPGVTAVTSAPQTFTLADSATGWSKLLPVAQFNAALGTLVAVNISLNGHILGSVGAENLGSAATVFSATETATLNIAMAGGPSISVAPMAQDSVTLGVFDGSANFAGTSGRLDTGLIDALHPGGTLSATGSLTAVANLAAFTGTGTYGLAVTSTGTSVASGGGNLLSELTQQSGGVVSISYTYTPGAGTVAGPGPGPTISGTIGGVLGTDTAPVSPFAWATITDAGASQIQTVIVTVLTPANGTLMNLSGGSYNAATGVYSVSGAASLVTAALDALVFSPTAHQVASGQMVTTGFTIAVRDTAGLTATNSAASVIVTDSGVPPTITGLSGSLATSDVTPVLPFQHVVIADPTAGQTVTVTARLSSAESGKLTHLGGGTYNRETGVYVVTGSAATVTGALNNLLFVPHADEAAPGRTVTTGITIAVRDTQGSSATGATTSVVTTASGIAIDDRTSATAPPTAAPHRYGGPVAGLTDEYVTVTTDNLNIALKSDNWFIHTGAGDDAITVHGGTNVLDGGTGSNFLTGGTGTDTFFVDDRSATADIWSSVVGLHSGDAATVWGITPGTATLTWTDAQGAAGYTGLTLHASTAGKPTASLTLAGYTQADLTNGRLSASFGSDPASSAQYLYIHAN